LRRSAVAALVLTLVAASGCSTRGGGGPSPSAMASPFVFVDPATTSPTDQAIARAQDRLRADDRDDNARLALVEAFLQKVRENGDASLYTRAEALLGQAKSGRDAEPVILVAEGTLALARHRFDDALRLGRKASALAPGNVGALGVVVDALNELGRYDEALAATQAMADARPSLSSLARVSYARELRGDLPGAVAAMAQAAAAGTASGENLAYVQVQLGNLQLTTGDVAGAEASYAAADAAFSGFPPAKAGRARVLVARGAPGAAADVLAEVVAALPTAEYAIAHGDALAAAGRKAEADDAYDLVDAIARLYRANGVDVDLELALFAADHRPGKEAVERARRTVDERPSIAAHDALAWSLFTAGLIDEAWPVAERAVALGTRDPQVRYHAAAIAMARGDRRVAARHLGVVLATNPRFSAALAPAVTALAGRLDLAVPSPEGSAVVPAAVAAAP
jgi:tetratricopeptide (TPR) repeat protein